MKSARGRDHPQSPHATRTRLVRQAVNTLMEALHSGGGDDRRIRRVGGDSRLRVGRARDRGRVGIAGRHSDRLTRASTAGFTTLIGRPSPYATI